MSVLLKKASPEARDADLDLLVVIPHLGAGGAQRVASLLVRHWQSKGVRIGIATLFPEDDAHALPAGVRRFDLAADPARGAQGVLAGIYHRLEQSLSEPNRALPGVIASPMLAAMRLVRRLRALLLNRFANERRVRRSARVMSLRQLFQSLRPRAIISFLGATNIQTLLGAEGLDTKVVISERNDPAIQQLEPPWQSLRPRVYPRADLVTANSTGALHTMAAYVPQERLAKVLNPLVIPPHDLDKPMHAQRIVTIARLVHQKGVDVLIDAFARVAGEYPDWGLDIIGDGPLREVLEQRAQTLGVSRQVRFLGHRLEPFDLLYAASVFALPSRFEGMPNAMLEAMACGLAVLASDASPGPLEFIRDGETGLVFASDNVDALADALRRVLSDAGLRRQLAAAARAAVEPLGLESVAAQWESLFAALSVPLVEADDHTASTPSRAEG
ncbi:glycosyltransferase [uncultured Thiohalocapsa sp.]|uniref:glycosyltransferase n=1 Tax=uncultured Thiohalocapsa sp. TaxID=768990 RepID=UPI0025FFF0CB|nr:glycosyltransferase [uncultured Thiohalocapsa sp.]